METIVLLSGEIITKSPLHLVSRAWTDRTETIEDAFIYDDRIKQVRQIARRAGQQQWREVSGISKCDWKL